MQEFTVQLFDDGSAQISGTGANLELRFGYSKNAHIYSVKFIRSKEWEDLYIRVHFHPEADIYDVEPVLAQNNIVNIPATVTSMPGEGKLTIEGTDGYKTVTSADIPYRVSENSGIDSDTDLEPGESSFQQFVDAVKKDAESATQAAKDAGDILKETKEVSASALTDIETAKANAISEIEKIETEVKGEIQEDVDSSKSSAEAAAKSAEEAKTAADSAKKSLSDLETAKQSAISDISKEKDTSVSAVSSAKEAALNEISKSSDSAVKSVKTAEMNAVSAVESEGSTQKTALSNASSAALTNIDTAKQGAVKAVEDKASEESLAIDEKASQVIGSVQNAGDAQLLAIGQATNSSIEQITQNAGQHLTQIDSAADDAVQDIMDAKEDSLDEFEAVNAHPPIQNSETGKWQVYNSETASYVDTEYDWEGGYYSPSVDSEGNLTWESSKEGMEDIPSSNIRGPQGLGVPTPTANDYGKAPTVNAAGNGYELTGPYAPLSAAIIETTKGNPAVCEDSVEWPLLGLKVYGKSTQMTTTGAQLFDITKATAAAAAYGVNISIEGEEIRLRGTFDNTDGGTITVRFRLVQVPELFPEGSKVSYFDAMGIGIFKIQNLTLPTSIDDPYITIILTDVASGTSVDYRFKIMVSQHIPTSWEPYTGGKPSPSPEYPQPIVSAGDEGSIGLTVSNGASLSQSMTITTPNGLPGIPVDLGWNYTDADGQQWVCDEIDYARKVYVQRVERITFDGSSDELWSMNINATTQRNFFWIVLEKAALRKGPDEDVLLCQAFPHMKYGYGELSGDNTACFQSNNLNFACSTTMFNNVDDWKQYLSENAMTLIYAIATPIETPISEEELAAYRVLHTYDSTTVITSDDALAEVEVDYLVKSKAYIEKKLTAIESCLNALEISEALEGE